MVSFSVDCKASAAQVGVERLAAVDNSKEFSFDVCAPCLGLSTSKWFLYLDESISK